MGNDEEIMRLLSEIRYAQEEDAAKVSRRYTLTIVLFSLLALALLPVLVATWHRVLIYYF